MTAYASNANGNWSDPLKWTPNGVPGDGDFADVGHAIVINQDIGTNGNGIKRIHIFGASASLTVDTSAARTIYFGSTGSDPIGTGSATNPGDDATMFGIFAARGTLNLTGTAANPVTLTSGDDASPIYIHHEWGDVNFAGSASFNLMNATFRYCIFKHLGANSSKYEGLFWSGTGDSTVVVDVRNCRFEDSYRAIQLSGWLKLLCYDNDFRSLRSATYVDGNSACFLQSGSEFKRNTAQAGAVAGCLLRNSIRSKTLTVDENAVLTTGGTGGSLYICDGNTTDTPTSFAANDNFIFNTSTGGSLLTLTMADLAGAHVNGGVAINTSQAIPVLTTVAAGNSIIENVFVRQKSDSAGDHAPFKFLRGTGHTLRNCIATFESVTSNFGAFSWDGSSVNSCGVTYDHNTIVNLNRAVSKGSAGGGICWGNGNAAQAVTVSRGRSNLVVGFLTGIRDDPGPGGGTDPNDFAADAPYPGVHHNATYDCTTAYAHNTGSPWSANDFDDGTNAHPHASYGDIDGVDPQFVDETRTVATWAASLGATGTDAEKVAAVFEQLSRRSGLGGTYDERYTITALRTYLFGGFAVQNSLMATAGHDGEAIGAMEYSAGGSGSTAATLLAIGVI